MNELQHVGTFFLIFAVALLLYSLALVKTGDRALLPYRAQHSIGSKEDVRRVGRITVKIALVIGVLAIATILLSQLSA